MYVVKHLSLYITRFLPDIKHLILGNLRMAAPEIGKFRLGTRVFCVMFCDMLSFFLRIFGSKYLKSKSL